MNSTTNSIAKEQFFAYQILIEMVQLSTSILIIPFNVALIYVILRNKPFRTSYGLLLAICCLSDAGTASVSFLPVILTLLDHKISFIACLIAQPPSQFGIITSFTNIMYISMDRLFAIIFPIIYQHLILRNTVKYVALLNCYPLAYICYFLYSQYSYGLQHPEINYKRNVGNSESQREQTRRISKSIMVIICVIFFCTFICEIGVLAVTPRISADPQVQYLLKRACLQPMMFAYVVNAPALYFCSTEYRKLMNKEFRIVRWLSNKFSSTNNNVVVPMAQLCTSTIAK